MINKPFRFLKDIMRFYEKQADNVLTQVSALDITAELWNKAVANFNNRGLHIPMYENHDETIVVGRVNKIEAREDGLYVVEHELNNKGQELVEKGIYDLPSGDFVLHYDKNGNVVDLEVFGVSIVNSEGAKDVELITMSKDNQKIALDKIIKQNKQGDEMDNEKVLELLLDDEFLKTLPEDILKKIVEVRKEEIAKLVSEGAEGEETAEVKEGQETETTEETTEETKTEDAGATEEKKEETEQKKACMSKFQDSLAKKSYEDGISVIPSTLKKAENFIARNYKDLGMTKAIDLAMGMCSFYGNGTTETVAMKKTDNTKMTGNDVFFGMAKGGR